MLSGDGFPDDSDNGERDYSCMIMRVMKNKRMMMIMRIVTFPSGKLFLDQFLSLFLLNSQEFFRYKIAKSQGFRYSSFKVKSHSDSIRVWFGLLENF